MATRAFRELVLEYGPGRTGDKIFPVLERVTNSDGSTAEDDWNFVVGLSYWFHPDVNLFARQHAIIHSLSERCQSDDMPSPKLQELLQRWFTTALRETGDDPDFVVARLVALYNKAHDCDRSVDEVRSEIDMMLEGKVTPLDTELHSDGGRVISNAESRRITRVPEVSL